MIRFLLASWLLVAAILAQAPPGYVETSDGVWLRIPGYAAAVRTVGAQRAAELSMQVQEDVARLPVAVCAAPGTTTVAPSTIRILTQQAPVQDARTGRGSVTITGGGSYVSPTLDLEKDGQRLQLGWSPHSGLRGQMGFDLGPLLLAGSYRGGLGEINALIQSPLGPLGLSYSGAYGFYPSWTGMGFGFRF